ncbi:MAG: peptidylprolyl isomerase [Sedimentisphaerales bacterium]|nr:peptidylprolyl isomerase [Sedimentisphaerales bacterium]
MCKWIYLSVLMLLLVGSCDSNKSNLTEAEKERRILTQKIELVEAAGGYVLMVGGETLTSDEIIDTRTRLSGLFISPKEYFGPLAQANELELFKERTKEQLEEILMAKISNILLYQYAKRQAGANIDEALENAAENEYRTFVLGYGGDQARADEELKRMLMDKKSFKEQVKNNILLQEYRRSKLPDYRPVTYHELMDCYNRIKNKYFARASKIRFRLIDIQPDKLALEDPNADPWQLGNKIANELLRLIKSGEDFGELAKKYSHGDWRDFGGLWRSLQPSSLAAPYDILAVEAAKIETGEIAGPIVTKQHIFIMKLEEKQIAGYEPFEEVQELVREKILLDRQNEVAEKLNAEIRQQAKLGRTDEFIDFCLEKIYQISNTGSET